jgi:muramidase (phage lysozyme)
MTGASTQDPKANVILDFVSVEESNGNYDAYIGHANSTKDLSVMTIAEIYAFMNQLVDDGEPSSAIGRYQFIHPTLSTLIQRRMIPLTTLFTPTLQDQLAVMLLNDRQYSAWLSNGITDEEFAHNISCEWASLPDPLNGGKSHYDGVGPNHAGRTLQEVYDMLKAARAA